MGWYKSKERRRGLYFDETFNVQIEMSDKTEDKGKHFTKTEDNNKESRICESDDIVDNKEIMNNNLDCIQTDNVCKGYKPSQREWKRNKQIDLLQRMRGKIRNLLEMQEHVDNRIIANDMIIEDIKARLTCVAGIKEKEKLIIHIDEHTSVLCLILWLAGKLAKVEENMAEIYIGRRNKKRLNELEKKRNQIIGQLKEAKMIYDDIDIRAEKVNYADQIYFTTSLMLSGIQIYRDIPW